jgi:EAL domain-containing protein (putative c-di-GMP-specific phosphodiesterase class I)
MPNGLGRSASSAIEDAGSDAGGGRHYLDVRTPLCFVIDADTAQRHFISLALQSHGIETTLFAKAHGLREALARRTPDFVFLDVPRPLAEAADSLRALTECSYRGPVQLMSAEPFAGPDGMAALARQHGLNLLPPLQKPVDRSAVRKVVREHRLDGAPIASGRTSLDEALRNDWIEFWYQPKIDLRKKQLAGVELFARVRHPHHGPMLPGAFMDDASEQSLVDLTERSLVHALTSGANFAKLGITFRLAVNVSLAALAKLSIPRIVREFPPANGRSGLILDVTEDQIASDLAISREIVGELESCGVKLAIDDFGRGYLPLSRLRDVPFAELKLDRSFVSDCATDKSHAAICRTVIDLAHNFDATAVAVGVEKPADALALFRMGCDFGQGYLFAQPMAQDRFLILLRQRAAASGAKPASGAAATRP